MLYFTNYHIHDYNNFRTSNKVLDESKQQSRGGIYRPKKRCTWTGSTRGTNLTKDTVKRQISIKEDSGVKEQVLEY